MEERRKSSSSSGSDLPPGFRFHPTDEELIIYYLKNQATSRPCPVSIIPEINIYKFDPWELPEKTEFGENEWYFFSPRDRKYPNGVRPNRATGSGYWKATGTDKAIHSECKYVGVKKALVFYKGRPPKGIKTDWIMHEYRLCDSSRKQTIKLDGSMRLDDWVLCRIYKKRHMRNYMEQKEDTCTEKTTISTGAADGDCTGDQQLMMLPRTFSLGQLLEIVDYSSISHLLGDGSFKSTMEFQTGKSINGDNDVNGFVKFQSEKMGYHQLAKNSIQLQVNQSTLLNQQIFVNPAVLEFQ